MADQGAWQPIETRPRDQTVLVVVEPTEANEAFADFPRQTLPAYVDERGRICCAGTWKPDYGLNGTHWRSVLWRPLPAPPSTEA